MAQDYPLREVVDLTDPSRNTLLSTDIEAARRLVAGGDASAVRAIDGHFAIVAQSGHKVRMARSLAVPLRYFIAKRAEGPSLVAANRIDDIAEYLQGEGLFDQFHPSYTRMVPAHYITEIALVGCPDPNPTYERFFAPQRNAMPGDINAIGHAYIGETYRQIARWIERIDEREPIGVSFSGGIDSGAIFLLTYHAMREMGISLSRLKAFTLTVDGSGEDVNQARDFLDTVDLTMFHEPIEMRGDDIQLKAAVALMEDYKPLDVQSGAMAWSLLHGIRDRYPDWKYMIDGDGGDENLKDYPIEENPELTIKSVLNNLMLYHEGWGVDSIKHSLTYSGGLSRGCTRTFAPASRLNFSTFSPFMLPSVIEVSEGIPFIELTNWNHERLYALKGQVVGAGVKAVTDWDMPIFEKRRFQHGAITRARLIDSLPEVQTAYRCAFQDVRFWPCAAHAIHSMFSEPMPPSWSRSARATATLKTWPPSSSPIVSAPSNA
ncbi:MAG: asparagine synthase-related protein [Planctomycetota bacterium]|jgi:asparagine synthase (glutamine-hydrolysing)